MSASFIHDVPSQRVVFAAGAIAQVADEAARLGVRRALVVATPGSGARLGQRLVELWARAAGLHAQAVIHVPKPVADAGLAAARAAKADGLIAAGGGAAIGLAKIIARDLSVPILAVPTTYSGSEATPIWGTSEGERKFTGRDNGVLPRSIVYDPDLPWIAGGGERRERAQRARPLRRRPVGAGSHPGDGCLRGRGGAALAVHLPRVVADGSDRATRANV